MTYDESPHPHKKLMMHPRCVVLWSRHFNDLWKTLEMRDPASLWRWRDTLNRSFISQFNVNYKEKVDPPQRERGTCWPRLALHQKVRSDSRSGGVWCDPKLHIVLLRWPKSTFRRGNICSWATSQDSWLQMAEFYSLHNSVTALEARQPKSHRFEMLG